jgi:hypothetical protein
MFVCHLVKEGKTSQSLALQFFYCMCYIVKVDMFRHYLLARIRSIIFKGQVEEFYVT